MRPRQPPDPLAILRRRFGYPSFRPGQEELVRSVIGGRDALGVLPTGGGKSVCYQVPAIALGGVSLVISPLVSLMEDQVRRARELGLRARHMSSVQSSAAKREIMDQTASGAVDLLFVAPERLGSEPFVDLMREADIRLVAVDEAHCISEWGHDFRPSYRSIAQVRRHSDAPFLALTATATPEVRDDIASNLALVRPHRVLRSFDRPNLTWRVQSVRRDADRVAAVHRLLASRPGTCIVYAATRRRVDEARDALARLGHRVEAYHAGMEGRERTRVLGDFLADRCRIVCATNAFGMGIDKPDVRTVVHLQLPSTLEAYYQEAGRGGRDGRAALCLALHAPGDERLGRMFVDGAHPERRRLELVHKVLLGLADRNGVADTRLGEVVRRTPRLASSDVALALVALERSGSVHPIHPLPDPGTLGRAEGLHPLRVGVWARADLARAISLRKAALAKLRSVQVYARGRRCRRAALLRYFGESSPSLCGACDRCRSRPHPPPVPCTAT